MSLHQVLSIVLILFFYLKVSDCKEQTKTWTRKHSREKTNQTKNLFAWIKNPYFIHKDVKGDVIMLIQVTHIVKNI